MHLATTFIFSYLLPFMYSLFGRHIPFFLFMPIQFELYAHVYLYRILMPIMCYLTVTNIFHLAVIFVHSSDYLSIPYLKDVVICSFFIAKHPYMHKEYLYIFITYAYC